MKKLLQKTIALAIAAVTMIASTVIVANAAEERNIARDEGVSYTITRLVGEPEGDEEGAPIFYSNCPDNDFDKLTDGITNENAGEVYGQSVGLAGTARSHRIKFDFGTEKTVTKVVLLNMWNSYCSPDAESGKPAGNRGYQLDGCCVLTGEDELAMVKAETENTEEAYEADARFFKVTLTLKEAVSTRYFWVDLQSTQPGIYGTPDDNGAYIISFDEIEIYATEDGEPATSETDPEASESEPAASESEPEASESEPAASESEPVATEPETNPDAVFDLDVEAPAYAKAGDKLDVVITVKNIKSENGLMAVAFTLKYDDAKVTPDVVAADPEKCEVYNKFMTKAPKYIMEFNGMDAEADAYENISRNYDGYYEFKFLDKMSYSMQKEGTDVNAKLQNDGDLVITVPFTVKEDVADGAELVFEAVEVGGTDAGNDDVQPFSIVGNGDKAIVTIGEEVVAPSESEPAGSESEPAGSESEPAGSESEPAGSESEPAGSESEPAGSESEPAGSESEPAGSESEPAGSESEPAATDPETPKTADTGMIVFFVFAGLALAGVVVFKKVRD